MYSLLLVDLCAIESQINKIFQFPLFLGLKKTDARLEKLNYT